MGKKGGWFSSVKKALSPKSKDKKAKKEKPSVSNSTNPEHAEVSNPHPHPIQPLEEIVELREVKNENTENNYSVEAGSSSYAAAEEVVRPTTPLQYAGKSDVEVAAIKIQTTFRGYLARRALRALRGLVRLKSLVDGPTVIRQTSNTLKCMQTLSRVQSQIQSRRIRMSEENRVLQRQLLQKRAKELESLRMGEEWDDSFQSKEKIEANLLHKFEAATRRERALAYSYTHQQTWKKSAKCTNILFMDPTNPHWGWSWLERWMAADKDLNTDKPSIKNSSIVGEITKSFARHQLNSENNPSSPPPTNQKPPPGQRKKHLSSPKGSTISQDEDTRSLMSVQSDRSRRHTIGGSGSSVIIRDDESSYSSVPSYMAPTRSAKAKSRLPSPLGIMENGEKENVGPAKKRLSFPPSPARARRHSGPPKVET